MESIAVENTGRPRKLGGSIRVRNVQELAANRSELTAEILEKYIRPEMSDDHVANISDDNAEEIPVIDMSRLLDDNCAEEEAANLNCACENWGFFQLVNHGVPNEVMVEMKENIKGFFQLPLKERETVAQLPGDNEGYGQAFVISEEQKLDWADMLFLWTQPPQIRNLRHWPTKPSTFREALDNYSLQLEKVSNCILGFMARNLAINPDKLIQIFGGQSARINYYPPCPVDAHDQVMGVSPHSDGGGLTLLLQVTPVAGLQIRRNGGWVLVKPLPNAFVVNIGDSLEGVDNGTRPVPVCLVLNLTLALFMKRGFAIDLLTPNLMEQTDMTHAFSFLFLVIYTNGKYKSIEHRAIVSQCKERMSIATFQVPRFGEMLGPLPEVVGENKVLYKTLTVEEYIKLFHSKKLDGKSTIEYVKLNR